ncbi:hypothetical protein [Francisella uliginis]|uniref:hypothetical protein n=1 Tax=Francisella uliginis TaxID=573570 RepID=UPI001F17F804|nr:hypothetical protein [Francisella uliginis]
MFLIINLAQAKYSVLNKEGQQIGLCNKLEIEKDDLNRFSRAIFSDCNRNLVLSFRGDFVYQER